MTFKSLGGGTDANRPVGVCQYATVEHFWGGKMSPFLCETNVTHIYTFFLLKRIDKLNGARVCLYVCACSVLSCVSCRTVLVNGPMSSKSSHYFVHSRPLKLFCNDVANRPFAQAALPAALFPKTLRKVRLSAI